MAVAQMEAWSTGSVRIEVQGGHLPIVAAVEVLRLSQLCHVIARADTEDPAFRAHFPIVMATVEPYPFVSLARDPLADLGKTVADAFFAQVKDVVRQALERAAAAKQPD
jgi:hypothetical protein